MKLCVERYRRALTSHDEGVNLEQPCSGVAMMRIGMADSCWQHKLHCKITSANCSRMLRIFTTQPYISCEVSVTKIEGRNVLYMLRLFLDFILIFRKRCCWSLFIRISFSKFWWISAIQLFIDKKCTSSVCTLFRACFGLGSRPGDCIRAANSWFPFVCPGERWLQSLHYIYVSIFHAKTAFQTKLQTWRS